MDHLEQLERLIKLRDAGEIDEAEYQRLGTVVLGSGSAEDERPVEVRADEIHDKSVRRRITAGIIAMVLAWAAMLLWLVVPVKLSGGQDCGTALNKKDLPSLLPSDPSIFPAQQLADLASRDVARQGACNRSVGHRRILAGGLGFGSVGLGVGAAYAHPRRRSPVS